MKTRKTLFVLAVFAFLFVGMAGQQTQGAVNTAAITCPSEVRIGNLLSCKVTGLTVGSNYIAVAQHSGGNVSSVKTAASTTEYFRFILTTADSDGIVPVSVADATTAGAQTGADTDTALVNLIAPSSDIPSAFFQDLLAPILIIGIFVLLMGAFFIYRQRRK